MRFFLTAIFVLLMFLSFGQSVKVTGHCVDKKGDPLPNVEVYSRTAIVPIVYSSESGDFELQFNQPGKVEIYLSAEGKNEKKVVVEIATLDQRIPDVQFQIQQLEGVRVEGDKKDPPFTIPTLRPTDVQMVAGGNVERLLIYSTAAVSNNELTSNYNVRGGSYQENLVYVNGFLVYRPFLTRSGQQEGMSFINSALVKSIQFSGGGFNAEYGDKLSSVLDITYKTPTAFKGSVMASMLGVEGHVEQEVNSRFNYLVGARYRSNGYFLNSLPTKGAYNPIFWDAQFLTNFAITENVTWSVLGHFSSNNYRFAPETQETDFGTANEAYSFKIYFDGQEETKFQTMMGGTSLKWKASKKTNLDFYATVFNTVESETFDILGEYFINELETDPSKEEFGDSIAVLGIGSFLNHARNKLNATIINIYHNGDHTFKKGFIDDEQKRFQSHALKWGVNLQMDDFYDKLSEWKMVDSAGYSVPQGSSNDEITLFETVKGELNLKSQRYTGFFQFNSLWSNNDRNKAVTVSKKYKTKAKDGTIVKTVRTFNDTIVDSPSKWTLSIGARTGYTTANSEFYLTPRAEVKYFPRAYLVHKDRIMRRDVNIHFATGMYYQPPFYREFRTFDGNLNLNVKAQKSVHVVLGTDVDFNMWQRESPFKFTAEAYYKYLWDVNTYEIDNVRTRYYANNDARGYAYGLDLNVNGEFIEGIASYFKVGLLRTREDVIGDYYYDYYNASGEKIKFGVSNDQTVVDSVRVEPGYIPRPTDQLINFGALIQDRMPKYESFTVQVGIQYGSSLPYGPPDYHRYKDTLRMKSYFRVDIGMSYDFLYKYRKKKAAADKANLNLLANEEKKLVKNNFFTRNFTDALISFEVFNLLGVNNVLSKQWIQDVSGKYYSIPNYLTQRRYNLKLILRF